MFSQEEQVFKSPLLSKNPMRTLTTCLWEGAWLAQEVAVRGRQMSDPKSLSDEEHAG